LVAFLLRNFGAKQKTRSPRLYTAMAKMEEGDKEQFLQLTDKYSMTSIIDEYPEWLIDDARKRILQEVRFLVRNIIQANSIYPTNESEFNDRRRYQTAAIGNCEQLIQELQFIADVIDVDLNKFMPYVDLIDREVALLKAWRKSDRRLLGQIHESEKERYIKKIEEFVFKRLGERGLINLRETVEKTAKRKNKKLSKSSLAILEGVTFLLVDMDQETEKVKKTQEELPKEKDIFDMKNAELTTV
jgi:hypothetical protein